jgi:hypothetical protein
VKKLAMMVVFAWVLWSRTLPLGSGSDDPRQGQWALVDAVETRAQCQVLVTKGERREAYSLLGRMSYHCFPPGVDPRRG